MTAVDVSVATATSAPRTKPNGWGGVAGVAFAVVLLVSALMTSGMPQPDHADKVQAWMVRHTGLLTGAAALSVLGVIIGVYFLTWLYSVLTENRATPTGVMFLVGIVIFATSGAVSAGLHAALGADAKHLSAGSLQLMASLNQTMNYQMTCIGLAVLYAAAGALIRRTGLLPGWLAWTSWVFAVLAASYFLGFVALLGMVLWAAVIGGLLAARRPVAS